MKTQNSGSVTVQKLEILYELQEKLKNKEKKNEEKDTIDGDLRYVR